MKTIEVAYSTDGYDVPETLELLDGIGISDVENIRNIYKSLQLFKKDIWNVNLNIQLFDIPEDCDFRYDVCYLTLYLMGDGSDIRVYQYYQNKYDASHQMESAEISLNELEQYLLTQK